MRLKLAAETRIVREAGFRLQEGGGSRSPADARGPQGSARHAQQTGPRKGTSRLEIQELEGIRQQRTEAEAEEERAEEAQHEYVLDWARGLSPEHLVDYHIADP
jgi:hypothetical protein